MQHVASSSKHAGGRFFARNESFFRSLSRIYWDTGAALNADFRNFGANSLVVFKA